MPNIQQIKIIGVDCAVKAKDIGIAPGRVIGGVLKVESIEVGAPDPAVALSNLLSKDGPTLLALDSPLGWPEALGEMLFGHSASHPVRDDANMLFRRETDRFVRRKIGKQPLEVGADRIARTAVASLKLLDAVSAQVGTAVPLAWDADAIDQVSCIEVYPVATLESYGHSSRGYKGKKSDNRALLGALVGV